MTQSPTFILVPGHWQTPFHLKPLTTALANLDPPLPSKTVQLHTTGLKPSGPRPCFSDDVSVIYTAVVQELLAGKDVCLVLHGYAGMPGAEAVNCLVKDGVVEDTEGHQLSNGQAEDIKRMGKVIRVVFIAAYIFPAKLVVDQKSFVGSDHPGLSIDDDNMIHMSSPWHYFFNDLPLSAAKPFVDACTPSYYSGPMQLTAERWRKAPVTALLCRKDNAIKAQKQEDMWKWLLDDSDESEVGGNGWAYDAVHVDEKEEKKEGKGRRNGLEWIEACHSPWVSRAEEVAAFLRGLSVR